MILVVAGSVILISIAKPIILLIVVALWAKALGYIDKDLDYFFLPRRMWNGILLGTGVAALVLWLLIPIFWIGWPLAVVMMVSTLVGYHFYRNTRVDDIYHWHFDLESFKQNWQESRRAKVIQAAAIRLTNHQGEAVEVPTGDSPMVPIYETMEQVFGFALPRRADRIELLADAEQTTISVMIDGMRYPQTKLEPRVGLGLIDFLKLHSGMDVSDRRRRQTGRLGFNLDAQNHDCRLTSSGTTKGLSMVVEGDPAAKKPITFDELGFTDSQKQQLEPNLDGNTFAVVVVCPPKHGMTTTLHALSERHDPYTTNIISLEPEITRELEGVTHTLAKTGPDAPSMSQQLTALMLRDPAVVLMGHLEDAQIAKVIPEFSFGVRFYVGIRQADTFKALRAWMQAVDDADEAGRSLCAIIAQRIVRKLCTTCRVAYKPDPSVLKKLNLPPDRVPRLFKHSGRVLVKDQPQPCPQCLGLGYLGRIAIFEVMALDDDARDLIRSNQLDHLRAYMRKKKMLLLQEVALARVVEGLTSISEITRVLSDRK